MTDRERPLVLVADDDDMQRLLLRETAEEAGFDVTEAADGSEAVAVVDRLRPVLVVLDVVMPGMDGFAACAEIRRRPGGAHTPILMATGLDDIDAIEQAYEAGATDFISKPIKWPLLKHRLRYMHRASCAFNELHVSQARLAKAEQIARLGSWEWDSHSNRFECSEETYRIFGLDGARRVSFPALLSQVHPDDRDRASSLMDDALCAQRGFDIDFRIIRPDGAERIIAARAEPTCSQALLGTYQDITERRQIEARIHHLAHHDSLTDLPNRTLFRDRLEHAIARAERDGSMVAVLCIDADRFKEVDDTLGHAAGDRLLQCIGERLQRLVRGSDTVARLGGDEFAIVQVGFEQPEACRTLSERILEALARPFVLDGHEVLIGASIGVAVWPKHGRAPDELLMKADVALYRAKSEGRGGWRAFEADMAALLRVRKELEQDLRRGLTYGWFELHYQPQVTVEGGEIVGAEALLRLRHPQRGLILPGEFISIAEETGLIIPIGEWALRVACTQAATWRDFAQRPVRVAVNLSPAQLRQPNFVPFVEATLREAGLPPDLLELEITENVLMRDTAVALDLLIRLRKVGVRIAMDDFGTGYSSLSYLKLFPFDRIKIDRSFVHEIENNPDAAAIVRAVVALGRSLNMLTTAEGVEDMAQLNYLKGEACDEVQGFYFGRAVPPDEFAKQLLDRGAGNAA